MLRKWLTKTFKSVSMKVSGWISNPKQDVFILGEDIDMSGENYNGLLSALRDAKHGDKIYIILSGNGGGWAATGYEIHDAIRNSAALVTTEARGQVSSAALHVLFAGDYVNIPKNDTGPYVAHMQFIGNMYHPLRLWFMVEEDKKREVFYKTFMTDDEYQRMMDGENVFLTGKGMCGHASNKIVDDADHCVIDNRTESK